MGALLGTFVRLFIADAISSLFIIEQNTTPYSRPSWKQYAPDSPSPRTSFLSPKNTTRNNWSQIGIRLRGLLSPVDAVRQGAGTRIYKAPKTSSTPAKSWQEQNHIIGIAAPLESLLLSSATLHETETPYRKRIQEPSTASVLGPLRRETASKRISQELNAECIHGNHQSIFDFQHSVIYSE